MKNPRSRKEDSHSGIIASGVELFRNYQRRDILFSDSIGDSGNLQITAISELLL
jgi:hypothetical protein